MAKITMTLCDVAPCTYLADREFEVNGQTIYVCGENCFVKFWSREYRNWKNDRYHLKAHIHLEKNPANIKGAILNGTSPESIPDSVMKSSKNQRNLKYLGVQR